MIEVRRPGLLTTVQDLGRTGYAHLGVSRSGALDVAALVWGNRLVDNPDGAAGLETTLTGVSLRAEHPTIVAVTGAEAPLHVDGEPVPFATAVTVPAGSLLEVGPAVHGVRSYLAFAGGVTVAPVLGSRSTDTLSGLGPPLLRAGYVLPIGRITPGDGSVAESLSAGGSASGVSTAGPTDGGPGDGGSAGREVTLRIRLGPRYDWLTVAARDALTASGYALSVKSNRIGVRLSGPVLSRAVTTELPSEGIVLGAVQLPADGQPLIFLADHPTTGGYPVIGVVDTADLGLVAQARPGTTIRFVPWT
jgi:biotin-dependent carboxylase-like uncharacterized protein